MSLWYVPYVVTYRITRVLPCSTRGNIVETDIATFVYIALHGITRSVTKILFLVLQYYSTLCYNDLAPCVTII